MKPTAPSRIEILAAASRCLEAVGPFAPPITQVLVNDVPLEASRAEIDAVRARFKAPAAPSRPSKAAQWFERAVAQARSKAEPMMAGMSPSLRHFTEGLLLGRALGTVRENTHITLVTADGPLMSFPMSTVPVDTARGLARFGFVSSLALALAPMPLAYGVGPGGAGISAALWAGGHLAGNPALAEGAKQTSAALLTCTIPGVGMVLPFLKAAADLAELRRLDKMEYVARFLHVESDTPNRL